jgi:hypothetical protein
LVKLGKLTTCLQQYYIVYNNNRSPALHRDNIFIVVVICNNFEFVSTQVTVNDKPLQIVRGALSGANVANCPHPCVAKPCGDDVQCVPIFDKYKCVCDRRCNSSDGDQVSFDGTSFVHYTGHEVQQR